MQLSSFLACFGFLSLIGAQRPPAICLECGASQYIWYNGSLSGSFTNPAGNCTLDYGPIVNASLYVGNNGPWDPNPFFFYMRHPGNDYRNDPNRPTGSYCFGLGGCTLDAIFNLYFGSTYWIHGVVPQLNISNASLSKTTVNSQPGYSLEGDEKSWSYGSSSNASSFEFQPPVGRGPPPQCPGGFLSEVFEQKFEWNATFPFTYKVDFTNESAKAEFSLATKKGTVLISFDGIIPDLVRFSSDRIVLSPPSKNDSPEFTFRNGTAIDWDEPAYDGGYWSAGAERPRPTITARPPSPTASATTSGAGAARTSSSDAQSLRHSDTAWKLVVGFAVLVFRIW